jgi:hypothetical protein
MSEPKAENVIHGVVQQTQKKQIARRLICFFFVFDCWLKVAL